jgi:hypothetical protein
MNRRNKFYLLVCIALCVLFAQALWAQTPVTIKFYGTDGGPVVDSLTLAIALNCNNDSPCLADSVSPTLKESSQGLPPAPQGVDLRVIPYTGFDCLSNYTSIHDLNYDTQTDVWKIQFQRDQSQTGMDFSWQSGLAGLGAGYWKIVGDPNEVDLVIAALNVDMTTTTMLHVNIPDTDPHTFFIRKGDGALMRSFTPDEIADAADSKLKKGKAEKRKAYKNDWCFFFQNTTTDTVNKLYVGFSQNAQILSSNGWSVSGDNTKKVTFTAPGTLLPGQQIEICGIGDKGKAMVVSSWYWVDGIGKPLNKVKSKHLTGGHSLAQPTVLWLKMPNINNIGEECYAQNAWPETFNAKPAGIVIGIQSQVHTNAKGKPVYRFVYHPKWKDALKTLSDKGIKHSGPAGCLLNFQNAKFIEKGQKGLPPGKLSNVLISQALALAFNIGASDFEKTHEGFGDMLYVNQPGDPAGLPAGSTVRQIDARMDTVMSCKDTTSGTYAEWLAVLQRINGAFSGPFDTSSFGQVQGSKTAGGTVATGVKAVADVDYLYRTSLVASPINITPLDLKTLEAPKQYQLDQNYPNPFNPTTTIQFSLPEDAFVTMKVYNMLGQEVATLAENEEFTEGFNDVTFDASSLASGVYFYRIVAQGIDEDGAVKGNSFISVKKMMLVK